MRCEAEHKNHPNGDKGDERDKALNLNHLVFELSPSSPLSLVN
jgi:hypothetical protein